MLKKFGVALAAVALSASPVLAQSARPLSALPAIERAGASHGEAEELTGRDPLNLVVPIVILAVVALIILGVSGSRPFDRASPVSP